MNAVSNVQMPINDATSLLGGYQIAGLEQLLEPLLDEGLIADTELHLVDLLGSLVEESDALALAMLALVLRAPRIGHVCVDLNDLSESEHRALERIYSSQRESTEAEPKELESNIVEVLQSSRLINQQHPSQAITVLDNKLFYLQRMWKEELHVFSALNAAMQAQSVALSEDQKKALDEFFPPVVTASGSETEPDYQRLAAERALSSGLTLISGGPGTGKTRTVARTLCALLQSHDSNNDELLVRLAAPTGKAASRLAEAIRNEVNQAGLKDHLAEQLFEIEPVTIHRLLRVTRDGTFHHHGGNPIAADVIVIDESSMVSLSIMNSLLDAVAPKTRLILVGDPYQLASVDAGAVFGDIVRGVSAMSRHDENNALVVLKRTHRFRADSVTAELATTVVSGESRDAIHLLQSQPNDDTTEVRWLSEDGAVPHTQLEDSTIGREAIEHASKVIEAARGHQTEMALQLLGEFKLLCGTRHGERGMHAWNRAIETALKQRYRDLIVGQWYVGRPVIMTRNDYQLELFNGEVGVTVPTEEGIKVAFEDGDTLRFVDPILLTDVESQWAMTIHKSQGSEYRHAVVILPEPPSPILTRELLYTGLTRAKPNVTIAAPAASVQLAIDTPVRRASGLTQRFVSPM